MKRSIVKSLIGLSLMFSFVGNNYALNNMPHIEKDKKAKEEKKPAKRESRDEKANAVSMLQKQQLEMKMMDSFAAREKEMRRARLYYQAAFPDFPYEEAKTKFNVEQTKDFLTGQIRYAEDARKAVQKGGKCLPESEMIFTVQNCVCLKALVVAMCYEIDAGCLAELGKCLDQLEMEVDEFMKCVYDGSFGDSLIDVARDTGREIARLLRYWLVEDILDELDRIKKSRAEYKGWHYWMDHVAEVMYVRLMVMHDNIKVQQKAKEVFGLIL